MSNETETYVVTEGTDTLEGKAVQAGKPVQLTPAEALYHQSLGRIVPSPARRVPSRKPATSDGDES